MKVDGDEFLLFTFEQIALFLFYTLLKIVGVNKRIYFSYTALFSELIDAQRTRIRAALLPFVPIY